MLKISLKRQNRGTKPKFKQWLFRWQNHNHACKFCDKSSINQTDRLLRIEFLLKRRSHKRVFPGRTRFIKRHCCGKYSQPIPQRQSDQIWHGSFAGNRTWGMSRTKQRDTNKFRFNYIHPSRTSHHSRLQFGAFQKKWPKFVSNQLIWECLYNYCAPLGTKTDRILLFSIGKLAQSRNNQASEPKFLTRNPNSW